MSTDLAVQDHQPIATVSDALSVDELDWLPESLDEV